METQSYFETITSRSALNRYKHVYQPLHQRSALPAASGWGRRELFESRVVVSSSRDSVLPYRAPSSGVFLKPPARVHNAELSKIIAPLYPGGNDLTETELVHLLGGTAGMFWAALHRFIGPRPLQLLRSLSLPQPFEPGDSSDDVEMSLPALNPRPASNGTQPPSSPTTRRLRR
ncbi:hypothetical protein B0T24DRAFT_389243 [Lasiosphaeria ovina]|uniref:Uncharacterized protein n=1 Tax=Lasiosphaeria ovina TaxID=92902 RepID=A0AAE0N2T9_9PEZI|nr:hypothetical protein B0T24DRAFT_389243 [Lasiosphaeria ovina]